MVAASIFSDFWNNLEAHHEQAAFLALVGLVGSFAFIRMSTRIIRSESVSWWPGNIESESGLHLHHLVFGIVTMMLAGTLGFVADGRAPYTEICALFFGIGLGLTIDEFALWVHLEDVYWAREGRTSVDAVVITVTLMGLVLLGINPFAIGADSPLEVILNLLGTAALFLVVLICLAKGRILHGVIGLFIPPLSIYGASRLGKPDSVWAKRRYGERRPQKQARAQARFRPDRRTERFKEAFRDAVGGKPSEGLAAIGDQAAAVTREAGAEVRERAERLSKSADPTHRKNKDKQGE